MHHVISLGTYYNEPTVFCLKWSSLEEIWCALRPPSNWPVLEMVCWVIEGKLTWTLNQEFNGALSRITSGATVTPARWSTP